MRNIMIIAPWKGATYFMHYIVAPFQGANPFGHPTVGSSALRASSPTAILCHAPRGAFLRLRRWIVGGHALAAIAGICDPLGEHSDFL